jgi:hypothetical protein
MKVLVACEFSGSVRDAFLALGHEAYSCDILNPIDWPLLFPSTPHPNHIIAPVETLLTDSHQWDLIIAHPPCTYLTNASTRLRSTPDYLQNIPKAIAFYLSFLQLPPSIAARVAVENPPGLINPYLPPKTKIQSFSAYNFGDPSRKRTTLSLLNLPLLRHTDLHPPLLPCTSIVDIPASRYRPYRRSVTPPGLAKAMAAQWSNLTT